MKATEESAEEDPTKLDIEHDYETRDKDSAESSDKSEKPTSDKSNEVNTEVTKKEHTLLDDLKAAEQSLAQASAETVPEDNSAALEIDSHASTDGVPAIVSEPSETSESPAIAEPSAIAESSATIEPSEPSMTTEPIEPTESSESSEPVLPQPVISEPESTASGIAETPELTITPAAGFNNETTIEDSDKYGQMLQDALNSVSSPVEPTGAIMSEPDITDNPAVTNSPSVPSNPEINGVPEMNFVPAPEADILPPPPAPPIGVPQDANGPDTALPVAGAPTTPLGPQPAMQDQVYRPQASDPGAFKIPGM